MFSTSPETLPYPRRSLGNRGFSLVELLIAVALVITLSGLAVVSMGRNFSAVNLRASGTQCANLLESARGAAILRKAPVAVAIIPAGENTPITLAVVAYQPESSQWTQISKWEKLAHGVVMDPSFDPSSNAALAQNSPNVFPVLPSLKSGGSTYTPGGSDGYAYLVFMPSGALYQGNSTPAVLRLIPGKVEGDTLLLTSGTSNFFDLFINPSTGLVKAARSE